MIGFPRRQSVSPVTGPIKKSERTRTGGRGGKGEEERMPGGWCYVCKKAVGGEMYLSTRQEVVEFEGAFVP